MSYDVKIWSALPFEPAMLGERELWSQQSHTQYTRHGRDWQIAVFSSVAALAEDIPLEVSRLLPGLCWLTCLSLEGKATANSLTILRATCKAVAKATHGVVVDEQEGMTLVPTGVKRFITPQKQESFSVLTLSWWFLESPLLFRSGREAFISLMERILPEGLPRRYGECEPPQYQYAETGKEHFLDFLETTPSFLVWYPHRPLTNVHWGFPDKTGFNPVGFRSNIVEISIEMSALSQPGWAHAVGQFWRGASRLIRPFYGEARSFGGYVRRGATVFLTADAQRGRGPDDRTPMSWWWRGVPPRLGGAAVIGEVYQPLWPEFAAISELDDGLAFASPANWSQPTPLTAAVPARLVMPPQSARFRENKLAEIWPFGTSG
jgi:hypothetical protein